MKYANAVSGSLLPDKKNKPERLSRKFCCRRVFRSARRFRADTGPKIGIIITETITKSIEQGPNLRSEHLPGGHRSIAAAAAQSRKSQARVVKADKSGAALAVDSRSGTVYI